MAIIVEKLTIFSRGNDDIIDITLKLQDIAQNINTQNAILNIFNPDCESCITIIKDDKQTSADMLSFLKKLIPVNGMYSEENETFEKSTYSALKSTLYGCTINIPAVNGKIQLGQNQKVAFIDFGLNSSNKEIIITAIY